MKYLNYFVVPILVSLFAFLSCTNPLLSVENDTSDQETSITFTVGPSGKHVALVNGIEFHIPAGALTSETNIRVTKANPPTFNISSNEISIGYVSECIAVEPDGTSFNTDIEIKIPLSRAPAANEVILPAYWDSGEWRTLEGYYNAGDNFIRFDTNHACFFVIIGVAAAAVGISTAALLAGVGWGYFIQAIAENFNGTTITYEGTPQDTKDVISSINENSTSDLIPPPIPGLISPLSNTIVNDQPLFEWEDVIDNASDVKYSLSVREFEGAHNIVLLVSDLDDPFYQTGSNAGSYYKDVDSFPDGTYYWNIYARDQNRNFSRSECHTFTVETPEPSVSIQDIQGIQSGEILINYQVFDDNLNNFKISFSSSLITAAATIIQTDAGEIGIDKSKTVSVRSVIYNVSPGPHSFIWDSEGLTGLYYGIIDNIASDVTIRIDIFHNETGSGARLATSNTFTVDNRAEENHDPVVPHTPFPSDEATNQPLNITLSWVSGDQDAGDFVTYDIYFETNDPDPANLQLAAEDLSSPSFDIPVLLEPGNDHYWRVVSKDNHGAASTGPVWTFKTLEVAINLLPPVSEELYLYADKSYNELDPGIVPIIVEVLGAPVDYISEVHFFIDGKLLYDDDTPNDQDHFLYPWDISKENEGSHSIEIIAWDIDANQIDQISLTRNTFLSSNTPPQLSSGTVSPASGDTSTSFMYSVQYFEADGHSPPVKYVNIDGTDYEMSLASGSAADGTYVYSNTLPEGNHNYWFRFNDGQQEVRLPDTGSYSGPDVVKVPGSYVIYHHDYGAGIWKMNPDGSVCEQLIDHGWYAQYSPDGTKIAFAEYYNNGIFVMNADGTGVVQLTSTGAGPTWSPDGTKIAYFGGGGVGSDRKIWVMNADGTNQYKLSDNPGSNPSWSPDGTKICYHGEVNNGIWLINPDGSGERQLYSGGGYPDWSPDGTKIAYVAFNGWCIWVMQSDGSNMQKLTSHKGIHPCWSPDGNKLAYADLSADKGIWVIDINGTNDKLINAEGHAPDWEYTY